jgi:hypothetical protein
MTDALALGALIVSMLALIVALLDWQQISREEPWQLTKLHEDFWLLERVHRRRAVITAAFNFHGTGVDFVNDAGFPAQIFRRGSREVLRIRPSVVGTHLTINFRRPRIGEKHNHTFNAGGLEPGKGERTWSTPIY